MQKLIPSCLAIVLTIVLAGCQFETHPGGIYNTDTSNPAPEGSGGSVDKPNDSDGGDSSNGGNGSDGGSSGGEQPQTNTKPVAQFAMQANGLTVSLDASGSTDADSDTLTYKWDIDGDTSRNGKKLDYTFSAGGKKSITLVVNDGKTDSSPIQKSIQLTAPAQNTAPMADFSINVDGMTVTVDASNSSDANGDQLTYQWNFANEASKMGKTASHTFDFEGEQVIRLVVNDGELSSAPLEKTVTVSQPVVEPEPEQDALALIVPAVEKECLACHGSKPLPNTTINYGLAQTADQVKQGIVDYLTANPNDVQLVKDKPTNESQDHAGRWPFLNNPNKENWIAAVNAIAKELGLSQSDNGGSDKDEEPGAEPTSEALKSITPLVKENCLACHGVAPMRSTKINFGSAQSEQEVLEGIKKYLLEDLVAVRLVQSKPTNPEIKHTGGALFENEPARANWIAAVEFVSQSITGIEPEIAQGQILFTENYETQTVNKNPEGWGVMAGYNYYPEPGNRYEKDSTESAGFIYVTDKITHGNSGKALYVNSKGLQESRAYSYKELVLPNGKERVFVRYYLYTTEFIGNRDKNPDGSTPNHNHFMALENGTDKEIRIGEVKGALGMNEFGADDIVPKDHYWYAKNETKRIEANTWTCIETAFLNDGANPELFTWVDGELVTHIDEQADFKNGFAPDRWLDGMFGRVSFGWANYGTYDAELYFDDIVVSNERIGCL